MLTALLVPQGMAYAELAGLPAVTGLYATVVPLLAYAVFGPSRILVLGPDSALAPARRSRRDPGCRVPTPPSASRSPVSSRSSSGAFLLVGSVARLGFLTDLFSKPVRLGYLAGIALIVIADQVPRLLGVPTTGGEFVDDVGDLAGHLGEIDPATAASGSAASSSCSCCGASLRRPRVSWLPSPVRRSWSPSSTSTSRSSGRVPGGLPALTIPSPSIDDLGAARG